MMLVGKNVGAVSIFLIIIFLSLVFLAGLIVDAARIMVAENKVEIALSSAARSVLAEYDPQIVGEFGLFAVDVSNANESFQKYFYANLRERHQGVVIIRYQVNDIHIEGIEQGALLNNEAFENQVLQYIKYKAPLTMTGDLLEQIRGGNFLKKSELLQEGLEAVSIHENIRKKVSDINKTVSELNQYLDNGAIEGMAELEKIFSRDIPEVLTGYLRYKEFLQAADDRSQDLYMKGHGSGGTPAATDGEYQEIGIIELEIDRICNDLKANALLLEQIVMLAEELKSLNKYESGFAEKQKQIKSKINNLAADLKPIGEIEAGELGVQNIGGQSTAGFTRICEALTKLRGRTINENDPVTQLIPREDFLQANQFLVNDERFNPEIIWQGDELYSDTDLGKMHGLLSNMSNLTQRISGSLAVIAEEGRDKLYIADYVLDKYTFVTSQTKRDHFFDKGEIEYILCGNSNEISNLTEVFGRIFFLRFSINTIDSFIRSRLPHFMLRLADALVRGFEKACEDVKNLYQGKGVPLCAEVGYTLKYSDYLKLFLFLQDKEPQLNRMRQLIQIDLRKTNPDFKLNDKYALLKAETNITINLWFSPALRLDKLGFTQFEGGKYSFSRSLKLGY